jgi:hypothetical protein
VDRLGDSDPFCVAFLERRQARTETVPDCLHPAWAVEFDLPVGDVASARLALAVFDEDDGGERTFMALALLPLAELADADAPSAPAPPPTRDAPASEVFNSLRRGARLRPVRVGPGRVAVDGWVELRERTGARPSLFGALGFLHVTAELETAGTRDPSREEVRADGWGGGGVSRLAVWPWQGREGH